MIQFAFKTNQEGYAFCEEILTTMVALFGIDESEALARINQAWEGADLISDDDPVYHEDEEYWAKTIYYGKDSCWWLDPPDLRPFPCP